MECVLGLGIIAFALPVVMLALAQAQGGARDAIAQGEARRAILSHAAEVLSDESSESGQRKIWVHDGSGRCLGVVEDLDYEEGLRRFEGQMTRYLVVAEVISSTGSGLQPLSLRLEYPAAAAAGQRKRIEVYSQIIP